MHHCWQGQPSSRPKGFDPVVTRLANLMREAGDPREIGTGPGSVHPPHLVKAQEPGAQRDGQHSSTEQRTWDQARGHQI